MQTLRDIDDIRRNLTAKLEELQRRANAAADLASTAVNYWHNPAVRFGLGVVIGLAFGGGRRSVTDHASESLIRSILRAGLMAATTSLVTRTLSPELPEAGSDALDTTATVVPTPQGLR